MADAKNARWRLTRLRLRQCLRPMIAKHVRTSLQAAALQLHCRSACQPNKCLVSSAAREGSAKFCGFVDLPSWLRSLQAALRFQVHSFEEVSATALHELVVLLAPAWKIAFVKFTRRGMIAGRRATQKMVAHQACSGWEAQDHC